MAPDVDPRTPDVTHARASVTPFVILTIIVLVLAVGAYSYWPEMQQVLRSPTPSGTAPAAPPPTQP